jgi:hypothetical protein
MRLGRSIDIPAKVQFGLFISAVLFVSVWAPVAAAQGNSYNGTWSASWTAPNVGPAAATLVVQDQGGSWQQLNAAAGSLNPCLTRPHPISVTATSSDELQFVVSRSKTISTCTDMSFKVKRSGDKLEGEFDTGSTGKRQVTLTKQ